MGNFILKEVIDQSRLGYAYSKIEYNDQGQIVDVELLEANDHFKSFLGFNSGYQRFLDVMPIAFNQHKDWLDIVDAINKNQNSESFDFFSYEYNCNCSITLRYIKPDHFIITITVNNVQNKNLDELRRLYSSIDNYVAGYLYILDMDYQIYYVSPACLNILGYNHKDLKNMVFKLLSKESLDILSKVINEELEYHRDNQVTHQKFRNIELEVYDKNGNKFIFENMMKLVMSNNSNEYAIIGSVRDITTLKNQTIELKNSKESLQLILDSTVEGVFGADMEGKCTFTNASCLRMLGYESEEELIGVDINKLINFNRFQADLFTNDAFFGDEILERKDGSTFNAEVFVHPKIRDGSMVGVVVTFHDVTNRKKVEEELKESERSKSVLLSNLPGLAYRCDFNRDWTMRFVSDGCYELTGYKPEELINNNVITYNDLIEPSFRDLLWDLWVQVIKEKARFKQEYAIITKSGARKWVLEQGQPIYNKRGEVEAIEGLIVDITDQKIKEEEVRYLSFHDGLTGVYNRIYFEQEKKRLDQSKYLPLTVIMGDINGLKLTNDAFGHDEGDRLIIKTAELLLSCVDEDAVVARTGGDEFSILMPSTSAGKAYIVLKKILQKQEEFNKSNTDMKSRINISLGFATKEVMEQGFRKIQKQAEDYMYKRKLLERDSLHSSIIASIKTTMYANSQETEEHAERINELSHLVGKKVNLTPEQLDDLSLLATLHDIGKVGVDKDILNKPGPLTEEEWEEMKKHPEIGYRIAMASPDLVPIAKYILHHHERWDGKGYPQQLEGEQIPLLSRIITVVDAYDAMTHDRPYRKGLSKDEAIRELVKNAGSQFDPYIVSVFVSLKDKYK